MEELEKKLQELKDVSEALEVVTLTLSTYQDYKKNVTYMKNVIKDIEYDIQLTEEDIDDLKEEENTRKTKEHEDYLEDCVISFNTTRL